MALNCPPLMDCEQECIAGLAPYNCDLEYFAIGDCAFQTPSSSWSCDPQNGIQYVGSECAAELDAFAFCVGI